MIFDMVRFYIRRLGCSYIVKIVIKKVHFQILFLVILHLFHFHGCNLLSCLGIGIWIIIFVLGFNVDTRHSVPWNGSSCNDSKVALMLFAHLDCLIRICFASQRIIDIEKTYTRRRWGRHVCFFCKRKYFTIIQKRSCS